MSVLPCGSSNSAMAFRVESSCSVSPDAIGKVCSGHHAPK